MPILTQPVPADIQAQLRRTVLRFRQGQHRRIFPTRILVGDPDGTHGHFEVPSAAGPGVRATTGSGLDAAQRTDLVGALLDRCLMLELASAPLLWVVRPGVIEAVHDIDAEWLAAGRHAFAECQVDLTMVVVTRQGWADPRSGVSRRWKRLRTH